MLPKHEKEREKMNLGKKNIFPFLALCVSVMDGKLFQTKLRILFILRKILFFKKASLCVL